MNYYSLESKNLRPIAQIQNTNLYAPSINDNNQFGQSINVFQMKQSMNPNKPMTKTIKSQKKKFTVEEDEQLRKLVELHGTQSWTTISKDIKGRTARQCRDRWNHYLSPDTNLSEWTYDEDQKLISQFIAIGKHWSKLSVHFKGRTSVSVRNRCCRLIKHMNKKRIPLNQMNRSILSDKINLQDQKASFPNNVKKCSFHTFKANNNSIKPENIVNMPYNKNDNIFINQYNNDENNNNPQSQPSAINSYQQQCEIKGLMQNVFSDVNIQNYNQNTLGLKGQSIPQFQIAHLPAQIENQEQIKNTYALKQDLFFQPNFIDINSRNNLNKQEKIQLPPCQEIPFPIFSSPLDP